MKPVPNATLRAYDRRSVTIGKTNPKHYDENTNIPILVGPDSVSMNYISVKRANLVDILE